MKRDIIPFMSFSLWDHFWQHNCISFLLNTYDIGGNTIKCYWSKPSYFYDKSPTLLTVSFKPAEGNQAENVRFSKTADKPARD